MGAWNTSLYGNDTARDVKGDYVHKLRSGKSDQEAMEAMLVEYERTKDDEDEGPLFWLATACRRFVQMQLSFRFTPTGRASTLWD